MRVGRMTSRPSPLIACLLALTSLVSCGTPEPQGPPPLSEEALAAVTAKAGAPREQLARAVDEAFATEGLGETRALIVLHDGEIAAERYGPGYGRDTRFLGWSLSKTLTAVMIGMLAGDGLLRADQPAPVPRWQRSGDPRADITLRHLLQMRSGLEHSEPGLPPDESGDARLLLLDGRDDMADYATAQPLAAEPGERFAFSSVDTVILADIAARTLSRSTRPAARRRAVADYLSARLFEPLGMTTAVSEFDRSGTFIASSMVHASARDWGKLGELLRRRGSHRGEQLVPRSWVAEMVTPSPASPHYGMQLWLNRPVEDGGEQPLFPTRAPATTFAMIGEQGQYVIVSPEQGLTIVRLGQSNPAEQRVLLEKLAAIAELYPAQPGR